ncbi:MFS transporter [Amycolatopsis sp. CA-128772]|uniref:MFS transporter n=1 Tax=Amycolatopsis sp. CA-128772 TaxID=2073159 RepID=UPI000CD0A4F5|nr:MFS transporter [Amycolatopsis sp. CA-128772]
MAEITSDRSVATTTAPANPRTGRPAGPVQAAVLLAAACLPVLGAVLLAPGLPSMTRAFAGTPGVDALVPLVLTAPALVIGLTAPFAGRVADRVGRTGLLTVALVLYAIVGTAPLYLSSLTLILASRVLVGLAEAAIMTCCTALLADYFHGRARERMLGLQVVTTTMAATVFIAVGGVLVAASWRTPFWLYFVSIPLALLAPVVLWKPVAGRRVEQLPRLPWRSFARPVGVTLAGGVLFYVAVVELSYRLDDLGVTSSSSIGLISALSSLSSTVVAWCFGRLSRLGTRVLVPAAFVLLGVGYVGIGLAPSVPVVVVFTFVTGLGSGLTLPSLLSWALTGLSYAQRGRGTGFWLAALFLGEFACPLVILALTGVVGGLGGAICAAGVLSLVVAVLARRLTRVTADR